MSSLAHKTVVPIRPDLQVVEQRVADTDDGFMRVANELTDCILKADLTVRQLKIMLAIMRKTYGFNKSLDRITNTQIAAMTGIHHTHVCSAKRQLIERGLLLSNGTKIGINKCVSGWDAKQVSQVSEPLADAAKETLANLANTHYPTQLNTKDNIQKTKDNINKPPVVPRKSESKAFDPLTAELPEWLPKPVWHSWVCYRKDIKKPIKSQQTVTQAVNLLERSLAKGYPPDELINQSIANGWQGLFEPKQDKQRGAVKKSQGRASAENFNTKDYGETQIPNWMEG
ncbi:replication protein [Enterobacteriaceae bacterium RIT711]|nr:replication protein [Enterobacteriaceae bacterium RIT711]